MLGRIIRSAAAAIAVALSLMMIAGCGKMNTNTEDSGFGEELPQYSGTGITGLRTSGSGPHTPERAAFTKEDHKKQIDAGRALLKELNAAIERGERSYRISAGYYRFLSNGIELKGLSDFELSAEDGTFLIGESGALALVKLSNCTNVKVSNLQLDYEQLSFFQGRIAEYDQASSEIIVTVDEGYREYFDNIMSAYTGAIHRIMYYDKDADEKQIAFSAHANAAFCGIEERGTDAEGNKLYKLLLTDYELHGRYKPQLEVGDKYVVPVVSGGTPLALEYCGQCTVENVSIYAASGFAVSDNFGDGGNTYRGVYVGRLPGTDRLLGGCSDGMHFISQKAGPHLENCEVSYVCDDSFNCHTFIGMTLEKLAPNEYVVLFPMISFVGEGSELSFFRYQDYGELGEAVVTAATQLQSGKWYLRLPKLREDFINATGYSGIRGFDQPILFQVTLDREIDLPDFTAVNNYGYACRGVTITNSTFHDVNGNGIVTRGYDVTITNSNIVRTCIGVVISAGGNWTEGPLPRNITVTDCVFEETNQSFEGMLQSGAVTVSMGSYGSAPTGTGLARNVNITGNVFYNVDGTAVFACNTTGITVKENLVYGAMSLTNKYYAICSEHYMFEFTECADIVFENNHSDKNYGELITGFYREQ